jgi:two-component system LytT family response regulator
VEACSNYSKIYFVNRRLALVLAASLIRVQELLPTSSFIRVHRSHLVNKSFIKQVLYGEQKMVELTNGEAIAISRRKKKAVKRQALPLSSAAALVVPQEAAV